MPIRGLSDRGLALPEIGQIRKGAKKQGNGPGQELTYFRFEFAEGENGAAAIIQQLYGDKPNNIRVLLPFNEVERSWDPWKEAYTAGRMVGRSDGEFIAYQVDTKTGETIVFNGMNKDGKKVPHPADNVAGFDYQGNPVKFKNSGRLKVVLPELKRAAFFTVMTTSTHDILNISSQLAGYRELNNQQLAGIPFILRRVPAMVSTPDPKDKSKRVRRKKYLISIEVDPAWMGKKFGELNTLALPAFDGEIIAGELPAGAPVETEFDEDELDPETPGEPPEPEFMKDEPEKLPDIQMVEVLGDKAVSYAAKKWNLKNSEAAQELAKKNLGKMIAWSDFVQIVDPQPETVAK